MRRMADCFEKIRVVGSGSFGYAMLCRERATGKEVVLKVIQPDEGQRHRVVNEIRILKHLQHPNVTAFYEAWREGSKIFISMEFADGGDLKQVIDRQRRRASPFHETTIQSWMLQLGSALYYMHSAHILHRDLKSANVFLTSDAQVVKLGDFGISKQMQASTEFARTALGTPFYLSPEIVTGRRYNAKSDVWAAGVIVHELMTFQYPFRASTQPELFRMIQYGTRSRPAALALYSPQLNDLLDGLLTVDSTARLSSLKMLVHPALRGRKENPGVVREVVSSAEGDAGKKPTDIRSVRDGKSVHPEGKLPKKPRSPPPGQSDRTKLHDPADGNAEVPHHTSAGRTPYRSKKQGANEVVEKALPGKAGKPPHAKLAPGFPRKEKEDSGKIRQSLKAVRNVKPQVAVKGHSSVLASVQTRATTSEARFNAQIVAQARVMHSSRKKPGQIVGQELHHADGRHVLGVLSPLNAATDNHAAEHCARKKPTTESRVPETVSHVANNKIYVDPLPARVVENHQVYPRVLVKPVEDTHKLTKRHERPAEESLALGSYPAVHAPSARAATRHDPHEKHGVAPLNTYGCEQEESGRPPSPVPPPDLERLRHSALPFVQATGFEVFDRRAMAAKHSAAGENSFGASEECRIAGTKELLWDKLVQACTQECGGCVDPKSIAVLVMNLLLPSQFENAVVSVEGSQELLWRAYEEANRVKCRGGVCDEAVFVDNILGLARREPEMVQCRQDPLNDRGLSPRNIGDHALGGMQLGKSSFTNASPTIAGNVYSAREGAGPGWTAPPLSHTESTAAAVAAALVIVISQSLLQLQNGVVLRCPVLSKDAWIPSRACNSATPAALADASRLADITRYLTQQPSIGLSLRSALARKESPPQAAHQPVHPGLDSSAVAEVPEDTHRSNASDFSVDPGDTGVATGCAELQQSVLDALSNTLLVVDRKTRKKRRLEKRGSLSMVGDDSDFEDRMPELVDTLTQSKLLVFDGPNLVGITESDSLHTQAEGLFTILEHRIGLSVLVPLLNMLQRSRSSGITHSHVEKASSLLGTDNVHYLHLIAQLAQYIRRTNTLQRSKVFESGAR